MIEALVENFQLEKTKMETLIKRETLKSKKRKLETEIKQIIDDVNANLKPKLKKFHNSRADMRVRGGGGSKTSFDRTQKSVELIITESGYECVDNDNNRIPRNCYKKNINIGQGMMVHFRICSGLGKIVNVIIQTQSTSGGAYKKASFYSGTIANMPNENFAYLFKTDLNNVKSDFDWIMKQNDNGNDNVMFFVNFEKFKQCLENI